MDERKLREFLAGVQSGEVALEEAVRQLKRMPADHLGFACLDHHRHLRTGIPEVVYGENKDASQIVTILERMVAAHCKVSMVTRIDSAKANEVTKRFPDLVHHVEAGMVTTDPETIPDDLGRGYVVVMSAGTSDIPVAEEAAITVRCLGHKVTRIYDVGVAGIHRLFERATILAEASVVVVVAGMEGALPSVVGGMIDRPIIAVPTSVGYGTGFGGVAALLGMLNSCAPGVAVVNIDNGFGAGCTAAAINRKIKCEVAQP